ncbi:Uncharacterized protein AF_0209 [Geodia barretti]|uniref:Uncharacterized protein AF_0209 n=1 Tax=Geodia barretti TaxID=519541 RepID=A0AA35S179_GEOBA|nr:Uncharacterized protein AF_0209 [Geodia barretti]
MAWALGVEQMDEVVERIHGLLGLMHGPPQGLINRVRTWAIGALAGYQPKTTHEPVSRITAPTASRFSTGTPPRCTGRPTKSAQHYRASGGLQQERMPVAVALGGDPATIWTGSAPIPPDMDEMAVAGFIREEAVELVKAKTCDLLVPAHAEIVLEGYVIPGDERPEGPFGDHTGYYSAAEPYPVFHVTAITTAGTPYTPR